MRVHAIRLAEEADHDRLLAIYNAARRAAGCFHAPVATAEQFAKLIEGEEILVCEHEGRIAGFVGGWKSDRFIHHLYVLPELQRRGIGSALLNACQARLGSRVSLKCDASNLAAQAFYRRRGWVESGSGPGDFGPWIRLTLAQRGTNCDAPAGRTPE
ncbi:MAG: GNAT family N-acetyltransferase [Planctomycetaceae bacterium]|nr:GNAT family N-acetyltransferase [Planctomycetaceae bacterium]